MSQRLIETGAAEVRLCCVTCYEYIFGPSRLVNELCAATSSSTTQHAGQLKTLLLNEHSEIRNEKLLTLVFSLIKQVVLRNTLQKCESLQLHRYFKFVKGLHQRLTSSRNVTMHAQLVQILERECG